MAFKLETMDGGNLSHVFAAISNGGRSYLETMKILRLYYSLGTMEGWGLLPLEGSDVVPRQVN